MDLANQLLEPIARANEQLSHASAAAIASTALMIAEIQAFVDDGAARSRFDAQKLILLAPGATTLPADNVQDYLWRLALAAEAAATNNTCSSILAGPGSESDDTGDVGLWLGAGDFSTPDRVLEGLGLGDWARDGEVIGYRTRGVYPTYRLQVAMTEGAQATGAELIYLLGELEDQISFRAHATMTGGVVIFIAVGRVKGDGGWAGLAGIGTWS
ncbi:hypothetical protein H0H81_011847 [Sphagnurus paluster]|uniref:Uncharacterized protein n=1 Tax=Sphagnurus paluster TaxID=117069 RepID=A0A9P7KIA5_9AGAR|nr:hypothetical protein H0H81_011847 [Sphagnurus paluster]